MGYRSGFFRPNSLRLKGYDYSKAGFYFVTICTQGNHTIFGRIRNGIMKLNENGRITETCLINLSNHYANMELDTYTIMPNHVHVIFRLYDPDVGAGLKPAPTKIKRNHPMSEIIRGFKTFSSHHVNEIRNKPGEPVWQRNYYDRVIRDKKELNRIRAYIRLNPKLWDERNNRFSIHPEIRK